MAGAYEIIMNNRKELIDALIRNMEKGYFWTENAWSSAALRPYNPVSDCYYHGGNRARLMLAAMANNYNDPRWCTYNHAKANGWNIRRGAKSVLLEKWTFTETKTVENEHGKLVKETVELKTPKVNYFRVFNASQIHGIPKLEIAPAPDYDAIIKATAQSSRCPIIEKAVPQAHYIPSRDIIEIPSRFAFKSAESYLSVQIHEMSHSTGHPDRLNRPIVNKFGTPDYAREELRAELSSAFFKGNLNLPLSNEQLQDHSNYLKSWIQVLKDDPNEFFKACQDAEKISDYLQKNYEQVLEHEIHQEQSVLPKQINPEETEQKLSADVATNMGNIPIEDYREIIAIQNGFDSYKEMLDAKVVIDLEESLPFSEAENTYLNAPAVKAVDINHNTNGFYGMVTFSLGTSQDSIIYSFYDDQTDYTQEINYQNLKGTHNSGTVLTRKQFIANIAKALKTCGPYTSIGANLHGDYTSEVIEWQKNHPAAVTVPSELAKLNHKVETVHNWEITNGIDEKDCTTRADGHTGQVFIESEQAFEKRYNEIIALEIEQNQSSPYMEQLSKISEACEDKTSIDEYLSFIDRMHQMPHEKPRLFVDMDGTLTEFLPQTSMNPLYQKGYFSELPPHKNVVAAIKYIIEYHPEIEVNILSAYLKDSEYALSEKNEWLDKYLPEIDEEHRIFVPNGCDKKEWVGELGKNDFLLDDYTHNLLKWSPAPGIKLINAINHTNGTWQLDSIRYDRDPVDLAKSIVGIVTGQEHVYEINEPSEELQQAPMEQNEYMNRESERQLVPKSFWTINIFHSDIPCYYDTLEDALHDYFTQPLSHQAVPYDSRALGVFFDTGHEYSILQRDYGVDIVNPDRFDDPELKPFLKKINEKLLECRNPDETYLDRISLQIESKGLHMTKSLKENLEALHSITGKEYYIRDLAGISHNGIDFGEGREVANEIYAECRQQEWDRLQQLVAGVEV